MKTNWKTAEQYRWGDNCDGWHLLKQPGLSVIQERMPTGTSEVKHFHERAEQFFFVLQGSLCIEMNDEVHMLNPQEGMHIPPGTTHQVKNTSEKAAEFLVISAPASHGDRVAVP
ncbi:MAG: cupin domain-containing protein [Balneolaceae bacterium]|jgi:mannose-6-phosphate isomerase-like protein (cupin superfamily)